ncbi:phosphonate ABC transporter, permease protein PhnE [Evansella tamaricis]|uniref:Phosphonate ABC transporter, permease protein PhnE n=1 Tax=Evansella tamaricis TaxID=2069301 RepID=A0ABS6JKF0_9BACI|nr:phosphonate ABC transporter, permease protein PhnE [Evansella tamaricis]MBU9713679.1 phosphonate ABC transporter, permease protein PhnE [Evansella tamaricis]
MKPSINHIQKRKKIQTILIIGLFALFLSWSLIDTGFNVPKLLNGIGETFRFIFIDMFPPNLSSLKGFMGPALDTVYMSFVAMVISAISAFFLSFIAAYNLTPHPTLQYAVRGLASFLQSIPALVWVLVLVAAYGLGLIAGTIALTLSGTGLLTRSFAEILEEIDMGPVEAVQSTGASWIQVIGQAVVPQVLPGMVGWSLYKFDLNIREAAVIGMVGGGGIGFAMQRSLSLFQYKDAFMAILLIFTLIIGIEYLTNKVRMRLL